jgi:hypothetical protein
MHHFIKWFVNDCALGTMLLLLGFITGFLVRELIQCAQLLFNTW